jgi:signal transduction histidine kinase
VIGLTKRYVAALRRHLKEGARASLQPALRLGRQAVVLGLETLELARIHERALVTLKLSARAGRLTRRAERFFNEAVTAIVETQRAARQSRSDLERANGALGRRTAELAASNRQVQRGTARRRSMEASLRKSGQLYTGLLKESLHLPEGLRHLTHKILLAQEQERQTMSHQLQDEIAQILVGIQVRLLTLKAAAVCNPASLTEEITSAQRLVADSIRAINRVARELGTSGRPAMNGVGNKP